MNPESFNPLAMYGNKDIFTRRLNQGFTEVALGSGPWIGTSFLSRRIVRLFALYHPEGFIATYEYPKNAPRVIVRETPYEAEYTPQQFKQHLKQWQITMGQKTSLINIVNEWEE